MIFNNNAKFDKIDEVRTSPNGVGKSPIVGRERVKLTKMSKCCDNALELLSAIHKNVEKIIQFKKDKSSKSGIDNMLWREVGKYMEVLDQLGKVDTSLKDSINNIQRLCKAARNMLGTGLVAEKTSGLGLGTRTTSEEEHEEKERRR